KYRLMEGYAELRRIFLEMGAVLESRGLLDCAADVFFLMPHEIIFLTGGNIADEEVNNHPQSGWLDSPPEREVDQGHGSAVGTLFSELSPKAMVFQKTINVRVRQRKAQHALWELLDAPDMINQGGYAHEENEEGELFGVGCSPGTAEGVARVLLNTLEAVKLKPGEILVAPHTDPGWTPLFLSCAAMVTEIGGFLSHGATVAREYGIPA
ncbi:MAG: hypothetical protein GY862_10255, partial [Gammaproteobacteria bacterium]|nr:hypothetical protein [Gammaproteobacteria bacterium]